MRTSRRSASTHRFGLRLLPLALLAIGGTTQAGVATTVYVNTSGTCDYPTVQAAIDDLAPGSEIRLVGAEFLLPTSLSFSNRVLTVAGGYPACGAPAPAGKTTLRANFAGGPAVFISGADVMSLSLTLRDLNIVDGNNPSGAGGGIQINNSGLVTLDNVDVHDNLALNGGGISILENAGGNLSVNLLGGSRIGNDAGLGNDAASGGGVYCVGARVRLGHVDLIANAATNQGGGLYADNCEILSTADAGDTRIEQNMAKDGGGIYARGGSQLTLRSRIEQKISISHNQAVLGSAPQRGGGIFLNNDGTLLQGSGLRIDDNRARSFAAGIMITAAQATLDRGVNSCLVGDDHCSSLSGNRVEDDTGALTGTVGAAFIAGTGSPTLTLRQTRVANNAAAGNAILAAGDGGQLNLDTVLLTGNSSPNLLGTSSTARIEGDFITTAGNMLSGSLISNNSTAALAVDIRRSILLADGATHLQGAGTASFDCINTGTGGALGGTSHAPGFFDATGGVYRLASGSMNLDRCAVTGGETPFDIGGLPRIIDLAAVANGAGAADRGAYEDVEGLLIDSFE